MLVTREMTYRNGRSYDRALCALLVSRTHGSSMMRNGSFPTLFTTDDWSTPRTALAKRLSLIELTKISRENERSMNSHKLKISVFGLGYTALDSAFALADVIVLLADHLQFKGSPHEALKTKSVIDTHGLWR